METLRIWSPAPGAIRRPRKPSSSTGCVHAIENLQATGYSKERQHYVVHSRLAGRAKGAGPGQIHSGRWFFQAPLLVSTPVRNII